MPLPASPHWLRVEAVQPPLTWLPYNGPSIAHLSKTRPCTVAFLTWPYPFSIYQSVAPQCPQERPKLVAMVTKASPFFAASSPIVQTPQCLPLHSQVSELPGISWSHTAQHRLPRTLGCCPGRSHTDLSSRFCLHWSFHSENPSLHLHQVFPGLTRMPAPPASVMMLAPQSPASRGLALYLHRGGVHRIRVERCARQKQEGHSGVGPLCSQGNKALREAGASGK